jgi:hypothetical protein
MAAHVAVLPVLVNIGQARDAHAWRSDVVPM